MELIFILIRRLEITDEEGEVKIVKNDKIIKKLEAEEKREKDLQVLSKVKNKEEKMKAKLQSKVDKQRMSKKIKSESAAMDRGSYVKEEGNKVFKEKGPVVVLFGRTPEFEVMAEVAEERLLVSKAQSKSSATCNKDM